MHWEWRGMAINFVLEQSINLGNHIFSCGARKHPEMCAYSIPHPCVSLPHTVGASWGIFLHDFLHFPSSIHGLEPAFEFLSGWEERFMIWGFIESIFSHTMPRKIL